MDRRRFLAAVGATAGAGLVLSACGSLGGSSSGVPDGPPELSLLQPSFELLTGEQRRYAFMLVDEENRPVQSDSVEVYVADPDDEIVGGPFDTEFSREGEERLGTYRTHIDLPDAGFWSIVAVADGRKGQGAVSVVDAADSEFPAPGDPAVPATTPTTADDQGYDALCTSNPVCEMHEVSLDTSLDEGRPVVLLFATPAYCQTSVCGPAVEIADQVRAAEDWGDLAWVHVEIYTDAAETVAPPVLDWGLPSEPWLYAIGRDGNIVDRIDGPLTSADVADLARQVV